MRRRTERWAKPEISCGNSVRRWCSSQIHTLRNLAPACRRAGPNGNLCSVTTRIANAAGSAAIVARRPRKKSHRFRVRAPRGRGLTRSFHGVLRISEPTRSRAGRWIRSARPSLLQSRVIEPPSCFSTTAPTRTFPNPRREGSAGWAPRSIQ